MKKLILLALFMLQLSFSASLCEPMFKQKFLIQVVDSTPSGSYVVEGAEVWAYYQVSSSVGKVLPDGSVVPNYIETIHKFTNSSGLVEISVVNQERLESRLDCRITFYVKYFDSIEQHTINLENYLTEVPKPIRIKINAIRVPIRVLADSSPTDAEVVFDDGPTIEVKNGRAFASLPLGTISGYAVLREEGVKHFFEEEVTEDYAGLVISIRKVPVEISVKDENLEPIPFLLSIGNSTYSSDGNLELKLYEGKYEGILEAGGSRKRVTIDTGEGNVTIYLDLSPPLIHSLSVAPAGQGEVVITFKVTDAGARASGVGDVSLYVDGAKNPIDYDGVQYSSRVEASKDREIKIVAEDARGNRRTLTAVLELLKQEQQPQQDQGASQKPPQEEKGIDFVLLVVLIVVGLIVLGILYFIKIMYF